MLYKLMVLENETCEAFSIQIIQKDKGSTTYFSSHVHALVAFSRLFYFYPNVDISEVSRIADLALNFNQIAD